MLSLAVIGFGQTSEIRTDLSSKEQSLGSRLEWWYFIRLPRTGICDYPREDGGTLSYSVGDRCPTCGIGILVAAEPSSNAQFECDRCHTTHANAYGTGHGSARLSKIRTASGEKVRGKPKKEIEHQNKSESQVRYIKWRDDTGTKVIQVAYTPDGRIKHLDCKTCGNKWYLANSPDYNTSFQLTHDRLACKKCGAVTRLASTETP